MSSVISTGTSVTPRNAAKNIANVFVKASGRKSRPSCAVSEKTVTKLFFFKQKTAYEIGLGIPAEPLFRSQISISSLQTHNVNRCGRSRHLARKLSLRRKRSSPNVFEMAATETITSIILIKLIRVSLGTVRHPRRFKIVVIDIEITLK